MARRDSRSHATCGRAPRAVLAREALVVDRLQAMQMVRHQPTTRVRPVTVPLRGEPSGRMVREAPA